MRFLLPDELPPSALASIHALLEPDGEDPANWKTAYVWQGDGQFPTYAVVIRWADETRGFTSAPNRGGGFEAWQVTD